MHPIARSSPNLSGSFHSEQTNSTAKKREVLRDKPAKKAFPLRKRRPQQIQAPVVSVGAAWGTKAAPERAVSYTQMDLC